MRKLIISIILCFILGSTAFAAWPKHRKPPIAATPEPVTILMIIAGGAAVFGIKKSLRRK